METLRFAKHQALGNDFLIVLVQPDEEAGLEALGLDWPRLAAQLCHRGNGIGADGLILGTDLGAGQPGSDSDALESIAAARVARVRMKLLNSDGSSAEVSGNGMACLVHEVARSVVSSMELGDSAEPPDGEILELTVDTADGTRLVSLDAEVKTTGEGSHMLVDPFAEVHMPTVESGPGITAELDEQIRESFGNTQRDTGDVGNPHLVINAGRPMEAHETARLGAAFETYFPRGINVEFIWRIDLEDSSSAVPSSIEMTVWERGAGLTQACGTGAVTAAVRARGWGLVDPNSRTTVKMPGGEATISTDGDDSHPVLNVSVEHLGDHEWSLHAPSLDA